MTTLAILSEEISCDQRPDILAFNPRFHSPRMTSTQPSILQVYNSTATFIEMAGRVPGCYIPKPIKQWRKLYPNVGHLDCCDPDELWHIIGTDGILAWFYHQWSGKTLLGHLTSFTGPVAKHLVEVDCWDHETRRPCGGLVVSDEDEEVFIPSARKQVQREREERLTSLLILLDL